MKRNDIHVWRENFNDNGNEGGNVILEMARLCVLKLFGGGSSAITKIAAATRKRYRP